MKLVSFALSLRESADGLVARHAASALKLALGVIEASTFALIKTHVFVGNVDTADRGKAVTSKGIGGLFGFRINYRGQV